MNNGLWKLAVMVGVIGVGSFLAYQAQQGLTRKTAAAKGTTDDQLLSQLSPEDGNREESSPRITHSPKPVSRVMASQGDPLEDADSTPIRSRSANSANRDDGDFGIRRKSPVVDSAWQKDPFSQDDSAPRKPARPLAFDGDDSANPPGPESPPPTRIPGRFQRQPEVRPAATVIDADDSKDPLTEPRSPLNTTPRRSARQFNDDWEALPTTKSAPDLNPVGELIAPNPKDDLTVELGAPAPFPEETIRLGNSRRNMSGIQQTSGEVDPLDNDPLEPAAKPRLGADPRSLPTPRTVPAARDPLNLGSWNHDAPPLRAEPVRMEPEVDPAPNPQWPARGTSLGFGDELTPIPARRPPAAPSLRNMEVNDEPSRLPNNRPLNLNFNEPSPSSIMPTAAVRGDGTVTEGTPRGVQQPRLTIEKVAPNQAVLGQPLIYSVIVKNVGGTDAHQVTVEDRVPKGAELIGTSPRAELDEKRLIWKLGTLKPNESKKLSVKVTPLEQGAMGSVARVNFVAEVAAEIVISSPQLNFTMNLPDRVKLGEPVQVTFKVRNTGKVEAQDVLIRNLVPVGFKHPAGKDVEYLVGTLPVGEERSVKLELTADKVGRTANKAILTTKGAEPAEKELPVEVFGEQLTLTQTGPTKLFIGRQGTYTNTVKNDGNVNLPGASITQKLPIGVEFVEASSNGRFDPASRKVTWQLDSMNIGEERSVSVKVTGKATGNITTEVNAATRGGAIASITGQSTIEGMPSIAVEPVGENRPMAIGERSTLKIQLRNRGTAEARHVGFSVEVPQGLRILGVKGPGRYAAQGSILTFEPVSELDVQSTLNYEVQVEALAAGDNLLGLKVEADHLPRPIHRDEAIQVIAEERTFNRR